MEASTYGSILKAINVPINTIPSFEEIAKRHGTSRDTVWSIYSQQMQTKVMSRNHEVQAEASLLADMVMQGKEDLPSICRRLDLPPCFVARRILEEIPLKFKGVKSKIITEIMRDPKILTTDEETSLVALENDLAKNTEYSGHSKEGFLLKLEKDIRWCIEHDAVYSPASDVARRESGELYEKKLYDALAEACIAFSSESLLRQQGFMKTPDALLTVPIAVQNHIVCWIDSKATFGDIRTHEYVFFHSFMCT